MSRWFRFYEDTIHDAKLLKLSDAMFRAWTTLLCFASKHDGVLPSVADIAVELRCKPAVIAGWITELVAAGLLDKTELGYSPHNWSGRQFKSDTSNERVKRYRQRQCNVTETVTVTPPETESETEQTQKEVSDSRFEEFWKAKPRRAGADPKTPAAKLFQAAVRSGTPAETIVAAARRWAIVDASKVGTEYLPQAVKWLRDKRWQDYPPECVEPEAPPEVEWRSVVSFYKKSGIWSKWAGPDPDSPACKAPPELLREFGLTPSRGAASG